VETVTKMTQIALSNMTVRPLSEALGAEIAGVDAANLDDAAFERLRDALHRSIMIVIRDQALTPQQQLAFTRRFGDPEHHVSPAYQMAASRTS
jgi:taurine dioxygenase